MLISPHITNPCAFQSFSLPEFEFAHARVLSTKKDFNRLYSLVSAALKAAGVSHKASTLKEVVARSLGFESANQILNQLPILYSLENFLYRFPEEASETYPSHISDSILFEIDDLLPSVDADLIEACDYEFGTDADGHDFFPARDLEHKDNLSNMSPGELEAYIRQWITGVIGDQTEYIDEDSMELFLVNRELTVALFTGYVMSYLTKRFEQERVEAESDEY